VSRTPRRPAASAGLFRALFPATVAVFSHSFFTRQRLPFFVRFSAEVAANVHNSAPFRFVVAATCGPRAAAGSARVADASLSQLPQKGRRRLFARFCASCRRHYQRAAAVSCRGGGRRPRYRLRFAPALRAEIQRGSSVQQSHTLLLLYSPIFVLAAANQQQRCAACCGSGCLRLLRCRWLADTSHPSVFSHTQNPPPQKEAGSSWIANAIDACCVAARSALRVSAPVAMAAANGARPAAPVRLFRCRLDRGPTTCLHLAAWVAWFAHATAPAGMAAPTPSGPPHRLTFGAGSIERTTRSMSLMGSTGEPTRHVCRHGFANGVSRAPSARFWCGGENAKHPHAVTCAGAGCRERQCLFCLLASAGSAGRCRKSISRRQPLSRRPPLCVPCGYCLRQTPSVPPIGYRERLRSPATGSGAVVRIVGLI
jgi:hypothetical protein